MIPHSLFPQMSAPRPWVALLGWLARGFADQHDEKVEAMAGGIDIAVGAGTGGVAEGGPKVEKNSGGMGLGVRGQGAYG